MVGELESLVSLKDRIVRKYTKSFSKMIASKQEFEIKSVFDKFRTSIVQDIYESSDPVQKEAFHSQISRLSNAQATDVSMPIFD